MAIVADLQFTKLDIGGLETLIRWAEAEGWNPGRHDAAAFWAADPDGYYGYLSGGELIGGGAIVSYGGRFGFMGLFIVRPDHRSRGIGRKLWYQRRDTLLSRLNPGAAIGMDGVLNMQPFYQKGGFKIAYRGVRHETVGSVQAVDHRISVFGASDLDEVLAFDRHCFGFERPQFMSTWLAMPGARAFQYRDRGRLTGFAVARKTVRGWKVGPLFADTAEAADALLRACLNAAPGEAVFIDVPDINPAAMDLVSRHRGARVFECARMYYGKAPDIPIGKVFGVTTFELG